MQFGKIARRARRMAAILAACAVTASGALVIAASPASAAPTGYVVMVTGMGECALFEIDLASGATSQIGGSSAERCVGDLAIAPDGTLYGVRQESAVVENVYLVRFDAATGNATDVGKILPTFEVVLEDGGLTFASDGTMYAQLVTAEPGCDANFVCLYRVDPTDPAAAVLVGRTTQFRIEYNGLATSCEGTTVSVRRSESSAGAGFEALSAPPGEVPPETADVAQEIEQPAGIPTGQILTIVDVTKGSTSDVGPIGLDRFVLSLDFDSAGALWGVGFSLRAPVVLSIDPATGSATQVAEISGGFFEPLALAIPRACPTPIVLEPNFTG